MDNSLTQSEIPKKFNLENWSLSEEKSLVDQTLNAKIAQFPDERVRNILLRRVATGKRIRPFLLFAMNTEKFDRETLANLGTCVELAHQSSLIFDDTIDEHVIRDGKRQSLHTLFGNTIGSAGIADHLGMYVLSLHDQSIDELPVTPDQKTQVRAASIKMRQQAAIAQFADRLVLGKPQETSWIDWCCSTAYQKTSTLMALPFEITGIIRNVGETDREKLKSCGESLGRLYQLYDDFEDLRSGVGEGPLALTYPLAWLLDNKTQLESPHHELLSGIMEQKRIRAQDVEGVNSMLRQYQEPIIASAQDYISTLNASIKLPRTIPGVEQLQKLALVLNQSAYWNYETTSQKEAL